jgi:hypothetical protein
MGPHLSCGNEDLKGLRYAKIIRPGGGFREWSGFGTWETLENRQRSDLGHEIILKNIVRNCAPAAPQIRLPMASQSL